MNGTPILQQIIRLASENPVLGRLDFVSVELALLAGVVACLIKALRIRSARARALLWLVVLAKPVLGLAVGTVAPVIRVDRPAARSAELAQPAGASDTMSLRARQIETERALQAAAEAQGLALSTREDRSPSGSLGPEGLAPAVKRQSKPFPLGHLLVGGWLAGVFGFAGLTFVDLIRLRSLLRSASAPSEALRSRFEALCHGMNLKRAPQLWITEALESPALCGFLRPAVLLPRWLAEEADAGRLDWLLRHELTHWRLRDPAGLAVRRVAEALFFFHPAVWWAGKKWEEAMELACDRALLEANPDARHYAEQLYGILEKQHTRRRMPLAGGLFATRTQIGRRIEALLSNPLRTPARLGLVSLAGLAAVALVALPIGLGFSQGEAGGPAESSGVLGAAASAPDNPLGLSDEIRDRLALTGQAFQRIAAALASYRIDHDGGPAEPAQLTTPIAYLPEIPDDPFGAGPMRIVLRAAEADEGDSLISAGPDGTLQDSKPIDPADPTLTGDLVATIRTKTGALRLEVREPLSAYLFADRPILSENEANAPAGPDLRALPEELIRGRMSRAKADLRNLNAAMEAYFVDWNDYPGYMRPLTTPIAYLSSYPPDPFAPFSRTGQPGFLQMDYAPDYSAILLHGVGPDQMDQRAAVAYDPTNGTISGGDIVRRIDLADHVRFADPEPNRKVVTQLSQLNAVKQAVENWAAEHGALPENLAALVVPPTFLPQVPDDLFAPGRPVSYSVDAATGVAKIYSVGPDGDDDLGGKTIRGRFAKGEVPDGDLIAEVSLKEIAERRESCKELVAPMLDALQQLKEREGRDNAMIHYVLSSTVGPPIWDNAQEKVIDGVLARGWSADANTLAPYLTACQKMFEEVRKGAQLDYAMGIGWSQGVSTPVPNFLAAQQAAKMMCVEGRLLESQGKFNDALDDYLTVLTMGRDYGAPNGTLISGLISVAIQSISLRQIHHLVVSRQLDRLALQIALDRLETIRQTQPTVAEAFRGEFEGCSLVILKTVRENPEEARKLLANTLKQQGIQFEDMVKRIDRIEAEYRSFWDAAFRYLEAPAWERDVAPLNQLAASMKSHKNPMYEAIPSFEEAAARFSIMASKLLETQLATALELFRVDNGRYPEALNDLLPGYSKDVPADPFSGRPFVYQCASDGASYTLYGVGPDKADGAGRVIYDPTNGTTSAGDVALR